MTNTVIQIRRSSANAAPASLRAGELGYSYQSDKLFIGNAANTPIEIAGRYHIGVTNAAFQQANTARDHANSAYAQANAAYDAANSGSTAIEAFIQANTARSHANAAFLQANTSYDRANVAYDTGNGAFTFANTLNVRIIGAFTQANAAYDRANVAYDAGAGAFTLANTVNIAAIGAFAQANAAYARGNVAYELANGAFIQANTARDHANAAFLQANTAYDRGNAAFSQATAAYAKANDANGISVSSFAQANTARDHANAAFLQANTGYDRANVAYDTGNGAFAFANTLNVRIISAFSQANNANIQSMGAFLQANTARDRANVAYDTGNGAFTFANTLNVRIISAFAQANAANIQSIGAFIQANTARDRANTAYDTGNGAFTFANTLNTRAMAAFAQANSANIQSIAAFIQANTARDQANAAYTRANVANLVPIGNTNAGVYTLRSTQNQINFIPGTNIGINVDEDAAGGRANITINASAGSDPTAPLAFNHANAAFLQANTARDHANQSFGQANTARTQANDAYSIANIAFARANTANSTAVGNTLSGVFTLRTNRNGLNFIPGRQVSEVNVDDWSAGDRTNVTIHVDVTSPFLQANTARDQANLAFAAANTAHNKANDAYTRANNSGPAFDQANAAYTRANVANLVPIGNTNAGVYTLRSTQNQINFIPGTNIGINVDEDAAAGRANITITATAGADPVAPLAFAQANTARDHANVSFEQANTARDRGNTAHTQATDAYGRANVAYDTAAGAFGQANVARNQANDAYSISNIAFARANTANSTAVGNTLSGVFTLRTNRNGLNFIPGAQISQINVDDWSAGDRTNVTISVDVTSPFLQANTARDHANQAFLQANTARVQANDAYTRANNSGPAFDVANLAFARANTANSTHVGNTLSGVYTLRTNRNGINFIPGAQISQINVDDWSAGDRTNVTISVDVTSPFLQANTARDHANQAFLQANTARTQANDAYTRANNSGPAFDIANIAFARANTANSTHVGNTLSGVYTLRTNRNGLNFIPGTQVARINVDDWSAGDRTNVTIDIDVTSPFLQANTARDHANLAFAAANTAHNKANDAYTRANNSGPAFDQANTARDQANAAYTRANTANLVPVGNTLSGVYTQRSTRNQLNFIPGTNITINVDDDAAADRANITISSTATGGASIAVSSVAPGSPTANAMWWNSEIGKLFVYYDDGTSSQWVESSPGLVYANTSGGAATDIGPAFLQANLAFAQANTSNLTAVGNTLAGVFTLRTNRNGLNFIPGRQISEINVDDDSATNRSNITIHVDVTSPFLQANTARDQANTALTQGTDAYGRANVAYDTAAGAFSQANTARGHANGAFAVANLAFAQANTSNLTAVGNTLSGVFTLRTNRNGINFIPGRQISEINVDDWSAGERTNVTIHADVTSPFLQANTARDQANLAFAQANTSNLSAVGNTLSGVYTLRTNRNGFNFIPAGSISINVDDYAAAGLSNVTITGDIGPAFIRANLAHAHANAAFLNANLAFDVANIAFARANTANSHGTNSAIVVVIDGGGSTITTGEKAHIEIPFPLRIREWTIIGDQSGSISIDLWSRQYSPTAFPEFGNTIINGYMTVASARANSNTTLANFTSTRINAGNVLTVNVATVTTMTRATLTLYTVKE